MSNLKHYRRAQLVEFRDLFTALFKIPDKDVQKRVIDAINGVNMCSHHHHHHNNTRDSATQTDSEQVMESQSRFMHMDLKLEQKPIKRDAEIDEQKPNIKRRRRNKKIPRVEKYDASKNESEKVLKESSSLEEDKKKGKHTNFAELLYFFKMSDIENVQREWLKLPTKEQITKNDVIQQMIKEWEFSEQYDNEGYYPIHRAIINNNMNKLKRQCYVFQQKKKKINEIMTEDNETPIQLALKLDCIPNLTKFLLETESNFHQTDRNGNTLFHLVILHTDQIEVLSILLNKIELNFLLKYNDDGLTALHCAVIHNKFHMCKVILEYINFKTGINSIGSNINDEKELNEIFIKELNDMPYKDGVRLNRIKCRIINQKDLKHDRTALFFALGNSKSKLLIFLLLVNLADPCIEDRSGTDCLTYAKEMMEKTIGNELLTSLIHTSSYLNKCSTII